MLRPQRTLGNISALQETIAQKEAAWWLPALQVPIHQASVLHLLLIALLAQLDKFAVEVVPNQVQLFAMLATIAQWELKIPL